MKRIREAHNDEYMTEQRKQVIQLALAVVIARRKKLGLPLSSENGTDVNLIQVHNTSQELTSLLATTVSVVPFSSNDQTTSILRQVFCICQTHSSEFFDNESEIYTSLDTLISQLIPRELPDPMNPFPFEPLKTERLSQSIQSFCCQLCCNCLNVHPASWKSTTEVLIKMFDKNNASLGIPIFIGICEGLNIPENPNGLAIALPNLIGVLGTILKTSDVAVKEKETKNDRFNQESLWKQERKNHRVKGDRASSLLNFPNNETPAGSPMDSETVKLFQKALCDLDGKLCRFRPAVVLIARLYALVSQGVAVPAQDSKTPKIQQTKKLENQQRSFNGNRSRC